MPNVQTIAIWLPYVGMAFAVGLILLSREMHQRGIVAMPDDQQEQKRDLLVITKDSAFKVALLGFFLLVVTVTLAPMRNVWVMVLPLAVLALFTYSSRRTMQNAFTKLELPDEARPFFTHSHDTMLGAVWLAILIFQVLPYLALNH